MSVHPMHTIIIIGPAPQNFLKIKKIHPFHHPKVEARSTRAGQAKKEGIMACNKVKPSVQICFSFILFIKRGQN
jgi:hypothetical protein